MFIKSLLSSTLAVLALLASPASVAGIYQLEFSASRFVTSEFHQHLAPPQATVAGSFIVEIADLWGDEIGELKAISLRIDGHDYNLKNTSVQNGSVGSFIIGGSLDGASGMRYRTDDFVFVFDALFPGSRYSRFEYVTSSQDAFWETNEIALSVTEIVAQVPEPGPLALLLLPIGALAVGSRRKA